MSFTHTAFAIAGVIAAVGPVVIHLLNRRRYRTIEWGAMAFLKKALHRTRRALRLRDLLLLALRTAALLLFGVALARPFSSGRGLNAGLSTLVALATIALFAGLIGFGLARSRFHRFAWAGIALIGFAGVASVVGLADRSATKNLVGSTSSRDPVHAIFVIDNSRSMGTRTLAGTLLDAAKQRAEASLGSLPPGSRVSVLPLCGPESSYTLDAYTHLDDVRAALARISITDKAGSSLQMFSLAAEAAGRVNEIAAKRVIFIGDQQASAWPTSGAGEAARELELPVQVVQVAETDSSDHLPNIWIDSLEVQDGIAETNQLTTFLATIRCDGSRPVSGVNLVLEIDGEAAASQTVDLRPGQRRDVVLAANLAGDVSAGSAEFQIATLSLQAASSGANRLRRDDARVLAVPVVHALPVLFIDDVGAAEDLDAGRVGETYRFRRLLAPRPAEGVYEPFVAVRHLTLSDVTQETLADARLVVIAGVERPSAHAVDLLRQYVEQGGPLVIAAGGSFDPAAWTSIAWRDGNGVLPLPLAETPVGVRPSQAVAGSTIRPFRLDMASLRSPIFEIAGERTEAVDDLWRAPFFFQTVHPDDSDNVIRAAVAKEAARIEAERKAIADGSAKDADLAPNWLRWKSEQRSSQGDNPEAPGPDSPSIADLAARATPRVLARFADAPAEGVPYLVERQLGYGRVLFLSSGIGSDWDTLSQTNAIVLLDRMARSLIEDGLPRRDFEAGDLLTFPVELRKNAEYHVVSPDGESQPVAVDATSRGYAVRVRDTSLAGRYVINSGDVEQSAAFEPQAEFAVNGPRDESRLELLSAARLAERLKDADVTYVAPGETIALTGGAARGSGLWRWGIGAVMLCLLGEMVVAGSTRNANAEAAA